MAFHIYSACERLKGFCPTGATLSCTFENDFCMCLSCPSIVVTPEARKRPFFGGKHTVPLVSEECGPPRVQNKLYPTASENAISQLVCKYFSLALFRRHTMSVTLLACRDCCHQEVWGSGVQVAYNEVDNVITTAPGSVSPMRGSIMFTRVVVSWVQTDGSEEDSSMHTKLILGGIRTTCQKIT